jgi:hypothetical protein
MTIPAARVLAFPGIDLETLAKLRAQACDAFMRDDLSTYQDACMMMRKLIGGQDVSETNARGYHHPEEHQPRRLLSQKLDAADHLPMHSSKQPSGHARDFENGGAGRGPAPGIVIIRDTTRTRRCG